MSSLDRLVECCRVLENGKIKESRAQAEKMVLLLDNPDVVNGLNVSSERKEGMSWDRLFDCVKLYMLKEVDHFRAEKPIANPVTVAQRKQRRAECCSKIRHVIRKANEREIRLKTLKLINFLTASTQDVFTWQCFSIEYSYLFLGEILGNHKVSREIPFQALKSFIELYVEMFRTADSNYELIMQILEKLIYVSSVQYSLDYKLLFGFFKDVVINYSKKLTVTQQQSMMSACYTFCNAVCMDCRLQLCSFGEDVLETVMQMLASMLPKRFKSILISFLQLQMSCHHPNGASSEEDCMLAIDKHLWRGRLHKLYELLMNEMQQSGSWNKNLIGKNVGFEPDVLDLVVTICHQEFAAVATHSDADEPGTSIKRCRQTSLLPKIIEQMQTVGVETSVIIGWLQLVGALFKRFPNVLACNEDLTPLIQLLHQLVLDCKSYIVMGYLLDCIRWVFLAFNAKESKRESTTGKDSTAELWPKIYEVLLRSVSLNHCIPEGHTLMQQFIMFKAVKLTSELKCLFAPGISPVSRHSLLSLATIMKHSKLRVLKGKTPTNSDGPGESENILLDVRLQLVDWLLPSLVDDGSVGQARKNDSLPYGLMGEVLVGLFLQDCRDIFISVANAIESNPLQVVEAAYLWSTFTATAIRSKRSAKKSVLGKSSVINAVKDRVIQCLLRDCGYLLDPAIARESNDALTVGSQCCLVAKCLGCMVKHEVISAVQLAETPLCDVLQKLMLRFTKLLLKLCHRDSNADLKMHTLMPAIAILQQLYSWDGDGRFCKMVTQFCREMTSEGLLDLLFDLLYGNILSGGCRPSTSNAMEISEPEQPEPSGSFGNSARQPRANSNTRKLSEVVDGGINLLTMPLNDVDHFRLKVAQLLITICQHSRPPLLSPIRHPAASRATAGENSSVQALLLNPLTQPTFDMYRSANVQLIMLILKKLLQPEQELNEHHLKLFLDVLRKMCKLHFKDGEVSGACLEVLTTLLLRLEKSSQENKQKAMHLVLGFWDLKVKKKCGPLVELGIAKVIVSLTKCQVDTPASKINYAGDSNEAQLSPLCLPTFLESREFALSSFVAQNISLLFKDDRALTTGNVDVGTAHNKMLSLVIHSIRESGVGLDGSLKAKDSQQNWTASALFALSSIATANPFCLKEALLAMCTHAKEIPLSLNLVKKAIQNVAVDLKYPSVSSFIEAHLGYLVQHRPDDNFTEFMWRLSDAATEKDFLKRYYPIIVPHVFADLDQENIDSMSKALDLPWSRVVEACYPQIMAFVLPTLFAASDSCAVASSSTISAAQKRKAATSLSLLEKTLTQKVIDEMLTSRLHEIVVAVLKCVYVDQPNTETATFLPEPNPPFFSPYFISGAFQYLITSCNVKTASLVAVLCRMQDGLQNVLLSLNVHLESSHEAHEIYRSLLMYELFVRLVLDEFGSGLSGSWAFVLQDVVHVLAHQLTRFYKSGLRDAALLACSLLSDTLRKAISVCSGEICKHLPVVVYCLVPYLKEDGASILSIKVLAILDMIFDTEKPLKKAIDRLEPFPDWPALKVINEKHSALKYASGTLTLHEEILNFLQIIKTRQPIRHFEGLQHITKLLASRRDEFKELVAELEGARFADECKKNSLYMLIVELLRLCTSAKCTSEVAHCAAKCLGEVGPVPISSIVLHVDPPEDEYHNSLKHFSGDATSQCHAMVFHTLHSYLIGSCVQVKCVASNTLTQLLLTKSGLAFFATYRSKKLGFLFEYLHPFIGKKQPSVILKSPVSEEDFVSCVDTPSLWSPERSRHEDWVSTLVCTLIDSWASRCEIIQQLKPICQSKVEFCEALLPYLIHAILKSDKDGTYSAVFSRQIDDFFCKFSDQSDIACELSVTGSSQTLANSAPFGPIYNDRKSIKVMLEVVKFLRLQSRPKIRGSSWTAWDNNFWLDLNYLHLAKAAYMTNAYLTALLFVEIWWDVKVKNSGNQQAGSGNGSNRSLASPKFSEILSVSSCSSEDGSAAQSLMLTIYRSIGDPDAIYGCGASHLTDPCRRLHFYEEERHWQRALSAYDLALRSNMPVSQKGMLQAMYKMGLHHLSQNYFQNLSRDVDPEEKTDDLREYEYHCAWKLVQWSLPSPSMEDAAPAFDSSVYESLLSLRDNDERRFQDGCGLAYQAVVKKLQLGSLESSGSLYLPLAQLSALNHLENCFKLNIQNSNDGLQGAFKKWTEDNVLFCKDYDVMEPIISMHDSVLQLLLAADPQNAIVRTALVECLERQAKFARENGLSQWAETYIVRLRNILGIRSEKKLAWKFEEARIFWAKSEQKTAKSLLHALIEELGKKDGLMKSSLYAQSLAVYGDWLIETSSESASVVLEDYFEKSVAMQEKQEPSENWDFLMNTYLAVARYADVQYQRAANYVTSNEYQWKQDMILRSNDAAAKLRANGPKNLSGDQRKALMMLERQANIDHQELQSTQERKQKYLLQAVKNYVDCLRIGDRHDNRVFRLISLWFDNLDFEELNKLMKESVSSIPSYKFLPLVYQLAARMSVKAQKNSFNSTLIKLILQLTKDHPYHTLHVIMALSNASKDEQYLAPQMKLQKGAEKQDEDRVLAAKQVLDKLRLGPLGETIKEMDNVCDALMQFSYWKPPDTKVTGAIKIPSNQRIAKLCALTRVPPLTMTIKVDPVGQYKNVPGILRFEPEFKFCGGVNAPKQVRCLGSDGKRHIELVKGRDDLRQDAVMQQVFAMVNYLLCRSSETSRRKLQIRTYKVVPLSQRSGILQWCDNTMPLGQYLAVENAHKRINPSDWPVNKCRKQIMDNGGETPDKKLKIYSEICDNFKPVFRHFFLENFPDPPTWFEKRTAYIKSVATNSIVGYILGLGDRHVHNILIDLQTAELIHIDLGVAFDQGKLLPTPETVPFRLTRDIVDGMGSMGTEGIFNRCCEKTMQVMRSSQEVIVTILEVLLYDPLYDWTLSPLKACKLQNQKVDFDRSASEMVNLSGLPSTTAYNQSLELEDQNSSLKDKDVNKLAERVLLRLQEKLQGKEDDTILSVDGQVARLIQQAVDPENLCQLFHGWQAYL